LKKSVAKNFNNNHVVVAKKGQGCNPCRGVKASLDGVSTVLIFYCFICNRLYYKCNKSRYHHTYYEKTKTA